MRDLLVPSRDVLGMRVDATSYQDAAETVARWARESESRYVCVACVNNVMQASDQPEYMRVMNEADLTVPDGRPLVWTLRASGVRRATQVRGTYLTETLLGLASRTGIPVGILGGSSDVLDAFRQKALERWPGIRLAYAYSPPFRDLSPQEDAALISEIASSGARILLVALGCPKQEVWMWRHRGAVPAVMVGVGAAIDFIAGTKRQAPAAFHRIGAEWLFRLATEPRRLWRRYLSQNPRFLARITVQLAVPRPPLRTNLERRDAA
jgi:N-acetylglucosaminyldiphosphoundecaprenol N-acetyl-beta-D-mannosaminyltransferase